MSHETQSKALSATVEMLPPTLNHMYIQRADGGKALTREAETFRRLVVYVARSAARISGWRYPAKARLELEIKLTFPTYRKSDLDNRIKATADALALALGFNDACIDRIIVERAPMVRNRPICVMTLRILPARTAATGD
jgi:Holliday junction resolvase RusA-like endonuclease